MLAVRGLKWKTPLSWRMARLLRMFRGRRLCRWPQSLREAAAIFPRSRASLLAGKELLAGPGGGSVYPSGGENPLPAQVPSWERPGGNGAAPGCGWAGRTQRRRGAGQGGSGACCVGSTGPSPDSQRHRPARSVRTFQAPQGRRWRIPVSAPTARPAPHGTAAVPGTRAIARLMVQAGLFEGPPRDSEDEEEEWVNVATEKAALNNLRAAPGPRKGEGPAAHVPKHHPPHVSCCTAERAGHTGAALLQVSQEVIEELPDNSPPRTFLANSLIVDLHSVMPDLLDTGRLHYILEHINYWIVSRVSEERARVVRSSTALLRSTVTLPEFGNSAEFPRTGHHVAQLGLSLSDPAKDISRQAREGVSWLYQLLLHQRGLTIHEAEDLLVWDWHQDQQAPGLQEHSHDAGGFWKVLLGGAGKVLHPHGSAGHPRPPAVCQPGWAGPGLLPPGGSPAADWGQTGGRHGQCDAPALHHPALVPGYRGTARPVPLRPPATPAPCCTRSLRSCLITFHRAPS
ncbi:uncharacterized protein LOC115636159 [Gopherus evgoodei]|uniref:uncharacterized protein LOC115636159 n=1 Tax=Gopherus evgoodei TaxID=1825980 RepID=UPI0011CF076F|nr:uncharacterized protein LOC115636159 [Gopherus evgoodei]